MDPFLGEIRLFAGTFAPKDWALCNGQLIAIQQNTALFALLGTYYGGNGTTNFALPNLQGSIPLGAGQGPGLTPRTLGEVGGDDVVVVSENELASHTHLPSTGPSAVATPIGSYWAPSTTRQFFYAPPASSNVVQMAPNLVGTAGGGQAHENRQPFLVVNYIISLAGIFPQRP